ncbi:MAG: MaoC family dehydratase N-terminal domain-containing protein [Propionibacteriaceae bacterium]|nr:MaoC family dehydratase N-terminal domain-containing protein [Propionibacteriaceae bacterium]
MLGGYIHDLEPGDVLKPVRYVLTAEQIAWYADANEEDGDWFHSDANPWGKTVRPPTMIHSDKMRILEANVDKERRIAGMTGEGPDLTSDARIHYEYFAQQHSPAYVGEEMVVTCRIIDKYIKRGREYLHYYMEVHTGDGRLVTSYNDLTLLRYQKAE